jgi:hypothetical protein
MKRFVIVTLALFLAVVLGISSAKAQPGHERVFRLPASAQLLSDGSYSLGKKTDPTTGKEVEGVAFLHHKQSAAKVGARPGGGNVCYSYLAAGAKWKTNEPWLLDPANNVGLSSDFLLTNTSANLAKWESAANYDIFGDGSLASGLSADSTPDGQNEVMFGTIDSPGTIAVTIVWGYYSGPTKFREIVEWDQIFDQQDFAWSAIGETGKMDFNNISTHELGHAAGMDHPSNTCIDETMYAYAGYGETKKRDLNTGDIAGIHGLYH